MVVRADDDPLVVMVESPVFTLDTRISSGSSPTNLVVALESPVFTLDTRLSTSSDSLTALVVQAESPVFVLDTRISGGNLSFTLLVVQAESPVFVLDTRLSSGGSSLAALVVQAESGVFSLDTRLTSTFVPGGAGVSESPAFTLDTRISSTIGNPGALVVQAESPVFTLDTRLSATSSGISLLAQAESPAFTLDTRLSTGAASLASLVIQVESPLFTLDTRLSSSSSSLAFLVTAAESGVFTLDTRISPVSPPPTNFVRQAVSSSFTIDTRVQPSVRTLARQDVSNIGGKVRFSPDGLRLAKTDGSRVLLWNLQTTQPATVFSNYTATVDTVDFSPMGDQLLLGVEDGYARLADSATRQEIRRYAAGPYQRTPAVFRSDGANLLAGGSDNTARLWQSSASNLLQTFIGHGGVVNAVALSPLSPFGTKALTGSADKTAIIWNAQSGERLFTLTNHTSLINAVGFSPVWNTNRCFTAASDGTIRIWDSSTGGQVVLIRQGRAVLDAAYSADGKYLVSCDDASPGTAYIWDAETGALRAAFSELNAIAIGTTMSGVAISPDETALATSHSDGVVRLWDTGLPPRPIYSVTALSAGVNVPLTLRSHGLYYFEMDAAAERSLIITLETNTAAKPLSRLSADKSGSSSASGLSEDAEFGNLGNRTAKASTKGPSLLRLSTPPPGADVTGFRMTATKGHLPSVYDYDSFAQASVTNLHCEMPLAGAASGKFYVLVFAPYLSAGSITARIRAEYADFHLSSTTPNHGGNSGNVTAKLQGTGITPDTTARLFNGGAGVSGQLAMWADSTKAWFTFPLSNAPVGTYHVQISKPGFVPAVISNAFQVATSVGPLLQSHLTAPSAVRPARDYTLEVEYANVGDVDMAAPLFVVSASVNVIYYYGGVFVTYRANSTDGGVGVAPPPVIVPVKVGQIQFLGFNQDGPPGVLPPGARFTTPIKFVGDGSVFNMTFNLSVLRADSTPIDWSLLESQLRPAGIGNDLWAALWSNFKSTVGNTWADYLHALDNQAHLLALAGQPTSDAGALVQALFAQASGAPTRRTLAAALDAQAPAPGLPLQFGRFLTDGLEQRFTIGPLGRGWSHNFEFSLTRSANNLIVIRTPGGGARSFVLGTDHLWHGQTGDYASLANNYGGFILTEKDGTHWQFDNSGQLVTLGEPNGNQITLTYSGSNLTAIAHSAGPSFSLQYNAQSRLSQLTDQAGQITTYQYDGAGEHLLRAISPGSVTNSYAYQSVSNSPSDHALAAMTFPDNTHQNFLWDARGRLYQQSRDGGAELLQFTYDPSGLVTVRDASNAVTTLRVGNLGQLLQMTDPLGRTMTFNYDPNLNLVQQVRPTGDSSTLAYDSQGNATNVINPLAQQVSLNYGNLGRLTSLLDAKNQPMNFDYDTNGNLTGLGYADASAEHFGYDVPGNVTTWTNRRGQAIQFTRNPLGQLSRKTHPDGRTIDYRYDARGFLTNVADSAQGVTSLGFDARAFLTSITYPDGKGFAFEYNAAGRRTRRVGTDGYALDYGYDVAGRLQSLSNSLGRVLVQYAYDSVGRLVGETKGNGTTTTYRYDPAGQVIAMTNAAPDGAVQSFFNYTYDANGNRVTMATTAGMTLYEYDKLSQLTGVTYPGGRRVTYAYDAAGNRTVVNDNGTNTIYTANALNEYTQVGGASFTYDTDGNMTSRTDATGTNTFQYDTENRLVSMSTPTNGVWQYVYDVLGNRVAVVNDGVTNRYLHDPSGLVDLVAEYDAAGARIALYDHGLSLVTKTDDAGNGDFYSFDAEGNTRNITGPSGTLLNSYEFDVFGATTKALETKPVSQRFVGIFGVSEEGSDLYFMRARYYSASLGRFISTDPIGIFEDSNLYSYCRNSPPNLIDPSGLWPDKKTREKIVAKTLAQTANYIIDPLLGKPFSWISFGQKLPLKLAPSAGGSGSGFADWAIDRAFSLASAYLPTFSSAVQFAANSANSLNIANGVLGIRRLSQGGVLNINAQRQLDFFDQQDRLGSTTSQVVRPRDPNDKIGPTGIGPNQVVGTSDAMEYMIRFENAASASAPVQELIVVDYLDPNLDWTTVQFKEIAYGDRIITPPANVQSFTFRDTPPTNSTAIAGAAVGQMVVDAVGSFNPQIGRLEWRVSAIDTNTSYFPQDALSGFLPPENGTGGGQGYVRFSVRPRSFTPIGTGITNEASILFDGNDAIKTPPVWNIVGDVPSLATVIAYLPGQMVAGTPFTYTLTVTNHGATPVTNVVLTNALPSGLAFVTNSATLGSLIITNGVLTWNIGTLTNGTAATLTITVLAGNPGTYSNNITYSGGSGLAIFTSPGVITVLPSAPTLGIRLNQNGQVELFWPTNFPAFHVQKTSSLSNSNHWVDLATPAVIVGQEYVVTNGLPTGTQFYRLSNANIASVTSPVLGIRLVGSQIQLYWPTNAIGFHLQTAAFVGLSAVWEDVTNVSSASGGIYRVTVGPSGSSRYFRLAQP